jgi:tetratricopeptide (TPR) repeat protein
VAAGRNKKDRHVVPRWRSIRRTIEAGEFQNLSVPRHLSDQQKNDLEALTNRWSNVGSELAAAELVGAHLVSGVVDDSHPAIGVLLQSDNPTYRDLGARVRNLDQPASAHLLGSGSPSADGFLHSKIRESKRRIAFDPRNPIAWADAARRYTALGQIEQARKALLVARALAPESRYLLRVSARFLIHIGEPGAAARLLRRSARTNDDPWLMATLLSAASLDKAPLPGIRVARRILSSGKFRPIEESDLVSEIATLELKAGSDRASRKLFERSLGSPTDNSLAQAEWASTKLATLEVNPESRQIPFRAEALAQAAVQRGNWDVALTESWEWLDDQPFDTAAAIHTSYVAAIGNDDWESSSRAALVGLRANPNDSTLANNCAYALIEMGDLDAALPHIRSSAQNASERLDRVAIRATTGLFEFRRGNPEGGRELYREAIDLAKRSNEAEAEAMARSMLAREELRLGYGPRRWNCSTRWRRSSSASRILACCDASAVQSNSRVQPTSERRRPATGPLEVSRRREAVARRDERWRIHGTAAAESSR